MIDRYTRPEMGAIWAEENKFRIWLEIEILACEAQAELGVIPKEAVQVIRRKAKFDAKRVAEIEREVNHDVIAFLTNVGEYVGPESRFIHLGMTSSDVLDTAMAVQMKQSAERILKDLSVLEEVLARRVGAQADGKPPLRPGQEIASERKDRGTVAACPGCINHFR